MGIETGFFVGAVILGVAIAYGMIRSSRRKPENRAVTDEATKESYAHPESYTDEERERFAAKLK